MQALCNHDESTTPRVSLDFHSYFQHWKDKHFKKRNRVDGSKGNDGITTKTTKQNKCWRDSEWCRVKAATAPSATFCYCSRSVPLGT